MRDSVEDKRLREIIAGLVESIEGGKTLSEAMADYPGVFDGVFVNLMRAGEASGQVGQVLQNITENLKWQDEQAAQVKKLLMYPTFVVGVAVLLVIVFLMVYLVPQLTSFVRTMGEELPFHTQLLVDFSNFFVSWWYLDPAVSGIARHRAHRDGARQPVDGVYARHYQAPLAPVRVRSSRRLSSLGFPTISRCYTVPVSRFSSASASARGLVDNKAIADATNRAGRQIADGASISRGFRVDGPFSASGAANASSRREHRCTGQLAAQYQLFLQPRCRRIDGALTANDHAGDDADSRRHHAVGDRFGIWGRYMTLSPRSISESPRCG